MLCTSIVYTALLGWENENNARRGRELCAFTTLLAGSGDQFRFQEFLEGGRNCVVGFNQLVPPREGRTNAGGFGSLVMFLCVNVLIWIDLDAQQQWQQSQSFGLSLLQCCLMLELLNNIIRQILVVPDLKT